MLDDVEELPELLGSVAPVCLAEYSARFCIEGSEQRRRAVPPAAGDVATEG